MPDISPELHVSGFDFSAGSGLEASVLGLGCTRILVKADDHLHTCATSGFVTTSSNAHGICIVSSFHR